MTDSTLQNLWQAAQEAEQQQALWQAIELYSHLLTQTAPGERDDTRQTLRLQSLANRGRLLAMAGEPVAALAGYEQCYREAYRHTDIVEALLLVGWQCVRMGLYDRAYLALEKALSFATEWQDLSGQARALARLGTYWQELGRYAEALHYLERAEALAEYVDSWRGRMRIMNALGNAHLSLGQLDKAILAYKRALTYARQVGAEETAMVLNNLGETYQTLFDLEQARQHHQEALRLIQDVPFSNVIADLYRNLGYVLCQLREAEIGLTYLQKGLELSRTLKQINVEMQTLFSLALVEGDCGRWQEANTHAQTLISIAHNHQSKGLWAAGLYALGLSAQALGNKTTAVQVWQEAVFLAHEAGHRTLLWRIHASLANAASEPSLARVHRNIAADVLFQIAQPIADMGMRRHFLSSPQVRAVLMASA